MEIDIIRRNLKVTMVSNCTVMTDVHSVPNYLFQTFPLFLVCVVLESIISRLQGRSGPRLAESISSLSHGIISEVTKLVFRGSEHIAYIYVYENWRIYELPATEGWSWFVLVLSVDFCYYWIHRACHEINILWAQHQVHHSAEDFNMTVAVRQPALHSWMSWTFSLPLALFVHPAQFLAHHQFNLIYQYWTHTEVVESLGPLEYIFNTAKHHRVHHACNKYALDKNYGGIFIIWDRLFGTFQEEMPGVELIYGLVHREPGFNPIQQQTFYYPKLLTRLKEQNTWKDCIGVLFCGPSWLPGKPRLGACEDKLDIRERDKYTTSVPAVVHLYTLAHFGLILYACNSLMAQHKELDALFVLGAVSYIVFSLSCIGMFHDANPQAVIFEFFRCASFLLFMDLCNAGGFPAYRMHYITFALSTVMTGWFSLNILVGTSHAEPTKCE